MSIALQLALSSAPPSSGIKNQLAVGVEFTLYHIRWTGECSATVF